MHTAQKKTELITEKGLVFLLTEDINIAAQENNNAGFKTTGLNFLGKNTEAKVQVNDGVLPTPNDLVIISVNQELDTEAENNDTPEAN